MTRNAEQNCKFQNKKTKNYLCPPHERHRHPHTSQLSMDTLNNNHTVDKISRGKQTAHIPGQRTPTHNSEHKIKIRKFRSITRRMIGSTDGSSSQPHMHQLICVTSPPTLQCVRKYKQKLEKLRNASGVPRWGRQSSTCGSRPCGDTSGGRSCSRGRRQRHEKIAIAITN